MKLPDILYCDIKFVKSKDTIKNHKLRRIFRSSVFDILFSEVIFDNTRLCIPRNNNENNNEIMQSSIVEENSIRDVTAQMNEPIINDFNEIFESLRAEIMIDIEKLRNIDINVLKNILMWNVKNPNKDDWWVQKDFDFFIVWNTNDNKFRKNFWPESIAFLNSKQWFALISTNKTCFIVIPFKGIIEYNPKTKQKKWILLTKNLWETNNIRFWMQFNFNLKIIPSNVNLKDMSELFTWIYWK